MSAATTAAALGDARREGRDWRCRCPLHNGRSLTLRDGDGGRVLMTCWAGCDRLDVLAELRRRGLLDGRTTDYAGASPRKSEREDAVRIVRALAIWREARPADGTIVQKYLRTRGICISESQIILHTGAARDMRPIRPRRSDATWRASSIAAAAARPSNRSLKSQPRGDVFYISRTYEFL